MKPGRNDLCACGSGKKFKHCCLAAGSSAAESPEELTWRRLRRVLDGFPGTMLAYIDNVYGPDVVFDAWDEFVLWDDAAPPLDPDSPHMQVFMPWFFHAWAPDPETPSLADLALQYCSPTQVFLERKRSKLDPLLRRYLEACLATPFSFYEILHVDPGRGLRVRDIFTGAERKVLERAASMSMQSGDLLYSLLVETDGVTLLEACQPCVIPPVEKVGLVELRREIGAGRDSVAEDFLWEWADELRAAYLDITERILNPVMPELRNTDGEALVPQQLVFDIDSPESAFDALMHLAFGETRESLLESAEWDEKGGLLRVRFDWRKPGNAAHAGWDNTVMAQISVVERRLTADVNSAERAAAFKEIVEQALGTKARYRAAKIESLERALEERFSRGEASAASDPEIDSLMESPEMKAKVREILEAHYDNWINEKIPALNNRTPLAAVRDPDGREQVEALIRQIERHNEAQGFAADSGITTRLRERLGLTC